MKLSQLSRTAFQRGQGVSRLFFSSWCRGRPACAASYTAALYAGVTLRKRFADGALPGKRFASVAALRVPRAANGRVSHAGGGCKRAPGLSSRGLAWARPMAGFRTFATFADGASASPGRHRVGRGCKHAPGPSSRSRGSSCVGEGGSRRMPRSLESGPGRDGSGLRLGLGPPVLRQR
jgi:hypothetical protein